MTVEDLAERAGVSSGLVSQLERGRANPSLSNLQKLARALDVSLVSLISPAESHRPSLYGVVRAGVRKQLVLPREGIVYELLTPDLNRKLEMIRSVVPVDYDTSAVPYQHEGEECVHVLRGRIEAGIGDERIVLEPGDSITYDASVPHWWRNVGGEEGELISAVTPPSF
jgi:transcriptional regulator with XRE-family HTH domain